MRDAWTSFVFCAFLFGCGPHAMSAVTDAEHKAVETAICDDLPMACLCHGRTLRVSTHSGKAMTCGEGQSTSSLVELPTVLPPMWATLDGATKYFMMIIDRDAPTRMSPIMRYWLHGLFVDVSAKDVAAGDYGNSVIKMPYAGPTPPPASGTHSYQILVMKQPVVGLNVPNVEQRARFIPHWLLEMNEMCGRTKNFLVGSFEFLSSNPDGVDATNPQRPCVKSTATTTVAAAAITINMAAVTGTIDTTTTSVAGKTTSKIMANTTSETTNPAGLNVINPQHIGVKSTGGPITTMAAAAITTKMAVVTGTIDTTTTHVAGKTTSKIMANTTSETTNPAGLDALNPELLGVNIMAGPTTTMSVAGNTTSKFMANTTSETISGSSRHCDTILPLIVAVLFRVLLA